MQEQYRAFALTPLDEQSTHNLIVALFCVWLGMPLRPELRVFGLDDATVLRRALRQREWEGRTDHDGAFRALSTRELAKIVALAAEVGLSPATVTEARAELRGRRTRQARGWMR